MPRIPICKECLPGGILHPGGCPICERVRHCEHCKIDKAYCAIAHPELNNNKIR